MYYLGLLFIRKLDASVVIVLLFHREDVNGAPVTRAGQPLALHVEADRVNLGLLGAST